MRATVALVVVTLLVWTTRIGNIWSDTTADTSSKWASTALAASFTAFAVATALLLWRRSTTLRPVVTAFAAWTIGVWTLRMADIASGDHEAAFVVVHAVLALGSVVLAVAALRGTESDRRCRGEQRHEGSGSATSISSG